MELYNRLADTALRMLKQYGRPAVLRSLDGGAASYNVSTARVEAAAPTEETRHIVEESTMTDYVSKMAGSMDERASLIAKGAKFVYMDAAGREPRPSDRLVVDDVEYGVVKIDRLRPGPKTLLYILAIST